MAAPAYATDLTTFWLELTTTVTAIGSGGAGLGNPETDYFIQGSDCISKQAWTNAVKGFIIDALAATFTVPTDGAVIGFIKYDAQGSLANQSAGGLRMIIGSAVGAYDEFYVGGADTLQFDSWVPYAIDPNTATPDVSNSGGAERWVGCLANLPTTSGPTKGSPIGMDAIRYGRCTLEYTIGDITTPATFDGMEAAGNVNSSRWGLLELQKGAYQTQGFHSFGLAGTACYFVDADKVLFWRELKNNVTNDAVSANFNRVEIIHASTDVLWTNIIWSANGTRAKGQFVHTAGACHFHACQFFDWDTFDLLAATVIHDSIFARCNTITAPGTTLNGTQVLESSVDADTGAIVWDVDTNPNGMLDNMVITQGANAHHAITFGTNKTTDFTLTGIEFTDFAAVEDAAGAALLFLATSGSMTVSLVGCTVGGVAASALNFFKDDAAGIAVTLVFDTIPLNVTLTDAGTGLAITNARVYAHKDGDTGTVYFEDETDVNGEVNDAISYPGDTDVVGWARQLDATDPDYVQKDFATTITATGFDVAISLERVT
jgi:hypothetical protein